MSFSSLPLFDINPTLFEKNFHSEIQDWCLCRFGHPDWDYTVKQVIQREVEIRVQIPLYRVLFSLLETIHETTGSRINF